MSNHNIKGLGEAYRRHIVIDNIQKIIYIEVQNNLKGHPKEHEYYDIKNKLWYKYVPIEIRQQLAEAINGGYTMAPVINYGAQSEEYYVIQISEIHKKGTLKITD